MDAEPVNGRIESDSPWAASRKAKRGLNGTIGGGGRG